MTKIKTTLKYSIFVALAFIVSVASAYAAKKPVLLFSDIISGPKTGLNDGVGQGAIVTVWGKNLGSSKGSSTITIDGKPAAHVYYWCNADAKSGGGPSDLYTFHKMQEIAFSIPSSASDGAVQIKVSVNGMNSNGLNFTVRPGNIHYVAGGGVNSNSGTWASPWATVSQHTGGAVAKSEVQPGDIIYCKNVMEDTYILLKYKSGTKENPISIITYPGSYYRVWGDKGSIWVWNVTPFAEYWNISKIDFQGNGTTIETNKGARIIGNSATDYPNGNGCANGQGGAISGNWKKTDGGIKVFGNYIHDFGCDTTSQLHHVTYITNRSGTPNEAYEMGWNYLTDNKARFGLHLYDESACGDWTGTFLIHDNVVKNQAAGGFHAAGCMSAPVEVYNNIFINCGLKPFPRGAIEITSGSNTSHFKIYNNIIYGYGEPDDSGASALQIWDGTSNEMWKFNGSWEFYRNIIVDTKNIRFADQYTSHPDLADSNIWYNGGDGNPSGAPSWDSNPITEDPLFVNPANNDFHVQDGSPARR